MSESQYYYQPQERAFAPGIVKEWPKVIPHPTNNNGRLVRKEGDIEQLKAKVNGTEHYIYNLLAKITNNKYGPSAPPRKNMEKPQWIDVLEKEIKAIKENKTDD